MLEKLPPELVEYMIEQDDDFTFDNVAALSEVSKRVRILVLPILFRSINVRPYDDDELQDICLDEIESTREQGHLRYTRDFSVLAPFLKNIKPYSRCPHFQPEFENKLSTPSKLLSTLQCCEQDGLRSFTWDLGTCVPPEILGPTGYLNQHQKNIESLSLSTDGSCLQNGADYPLFTGFPYLRKLRWAGLCSKNDLISLGSVLREKCSQLQHLELDFEYLIRMHSESYEYFMLDQIMSRFQPVQVVFPALRHLTLCSVALTPHAPGDNSDLFQYFDFFSLTSLRLRHCPQYDDLLKYLSDSNKTIKLQSFELQARLFDEMVPGRHLVQFLTSFKGLRELYLALSELSKTMDIWRATSTHAATLTKFAYQQSRVLIPKQPNQMRREYSDHMDLTLTNIDEFGPDPAQNPLGNADLTVIGLSCAPEWMRAAVSPFTSKSSLEVVHLRRSGPDSQRDCRVQVPGAELRDRLSYASRPGVELGQSQMPLAASASDIAHSNAHASFLEAIRGSTRHEARARLMAQDPPEIYPNCVWEEECDNPNLIWPWLDVFLQWLFGPTGVKSLRLFIFGDVSHGRRFMDYNFYFVRNEEFYRTNDDGERRPGIPSYCEVDLLHPEVVYQLAKHKEVLTACPLDSVFDLSD